MGAADEQNFHAMHLGQHRASDGMVVEVVCLNGGTLPQSNLSPARACQTPVTVFWTYSMPAAMSSIRSSRSSEEEDDEEAA